MLNKLTLDEHNLLRELQKSGIPVNLRPPKAESRIPPAITLHPTGNRFDNAVHAIFYDRSRFAYGECCCVMTIAIHNQSDRNVTLKACRVKILSGLSGFRWLEKPRGNVSRNFAYSHAAYGEPPLQIDPQRVLNHRFASGLKIFPGDTVEGMLIGAADSELHQDPDHREVCAELVAIDSRGHRYYLPLVLKVLKKEIEYSGRRMSVHDLGRSPFAKWLKKLDQKWRKEERERGSSRITKAEREDKRAAETVEV